MMPQKEVAANVRKRPEAQTARSEEESSLAVSAGREKTATTAVSRRGRPRIVVN